HASGHVPGAAVAPPGRRRGPARGDLAAAREPRQAAAIRYQAGPVAVHRRPPFVCQLQSLTDAGGLGGGRLDHAVAIQPRAFVTIRGRGGQRARVPHRAGARRDAGGLTGGPATCRRSRARPFRRSGDLRYYAGSTPPATTSGSRDAVESARTRSVEQGSGVRRNDVMSEPLIRLLAELPAGVPNPT